MATSSAENDEIVIKKYANRRLYNTDTSTYITLDDLCQMVKRDMEFVVRDAKTGEDITRQILTQIIFEQESQGYNLLPINFLRSIISLYGGKMHDVLPHYLDASMKAFLSNQEKMREYVDTTFKGVSPFSQLEEIGKQNMALFQKAFQMFTPFDFTGDGDDNKPKKKATT